MCLPYLLSPAFIFLHDVFYKVLFAKLFSKPCIFVPVGVEPRSTISQIPNASSLIGKLTVIYKSAKMNHVAFLFVALIHVTCVWFGLNLLHLNMKPAGRKFSDPPCGSCLCGMDAEEAVTAFRNVDHVMESLRAKLRRVKDRRVAYIYYKE